MCEATSATTSTIFAHNSYLQTWVEAGLPTLVAFLTFLGVWGRTVGRRWTQLPAERRIPLIGVTAGLAAALAHALVDSDFSYFGIGQVFFMLLGVGLVLATDSVAPEFVPRPIRLTAAVGAMALIVAMLGTATLDAQKAQFRYQLATKDIPGALATADSLAGFEFIDGDTAAILALVAPPDGRVPHLINAYRLAPSSRNGRALAEGYAASGQSAAAEATFKAVLARDPNNFLTLKRLLDLQITSQETEAAIQTARQTIAIESTPYYQVRSIDGLEPTETGYARIVLAGLTADPSESIALLKVAVDRYLTYTRNTVAIIVGNTKQDPTFRFGTEDLGSARANLDVATRAATDLEKRCRQRGDTAGVDAAIAAGRPSQGEIPCRADRMAVA
jgi:hypothetical protein